MDFLQYTAGIDDEGRRLDRVIRIVLKDIPMTEIYKYIRKGLVRVNGKKSDCSYRIKKDDMIKIPDFSAASDKIPQQIPVFPQNSVVGTSQVADFPAVSDVFKNQYVRIVKKPYGMVVHSGGKKSGITLEEIIKQQFKPENTSIAFNPGPLHRIDRHTTGLVVFSQNLEGANVFSKILQNHSIKKEYLAILCGNLTTSKTWKDILKPDDNKAKKSSSENFHTMKTVEHNDNTTSEGNEALTKATPIAHGIYEGADITLALVEIETGRKHQIRCQSAHHGYPLLGDTAYGGKNPKSLNGHFFLHSWRMTFPLDNKIGLPNVITAPLPEKFQFFIRNHLSQCEFSL